jgi:hypothetical protein
MTIRNKIKIGMTFREWAICYAGALSFGGISWWATGSQWTGLGVIVIFTAVYVMLLKSRKAAALPQEVSTETMTRQQRRAHERKLKQK